METERKWQVRHKVLARRCQRRPIVLNRILRSLQLGDNSIIYSYALNNTNRSMGVTTRIKRANLLLNISRSSVTLRTTNTHLSHRIPNIPRRLLGNGFNSLSRLLYSTRIPKISNFLFSLNISSPRLSVPNENFSCGRSTPLSVQVSPNGGALGTTRIVGACGRRSLTQVLHICNRRGFTSRVTHRVIHHHRRRPVRAANRFIRVVGTNVPTTTHQRNKRPTGGDFRTVHVRIGRRLSILRQKLSTTAE